MKPEQYTKAIISGLGHGLTALVAASQYGPLTLNGWAIVLAAAVFGTGLVYAVPNEPAAAPVPATPTQVPSTDSLIRSTEYPAAGP